MRALIQRALSATASDSNSQLVSIGVGLAIFLGIGKGDDEEDATQLATQISQMRIFDGPGGKFDRSILEVHGDALVVSQFTLFADASKGRRPSFFQAESPANAAILYTFFASKLKETGLHHVKAVNFGSRLTLSVRNWGPFSINLDTKSRSRR